MSLSGSRLSAALNSDILSAFQAAFPIPSALLPAEKTALTTAQQNFVNTIGNPVGADIVTEITGHAVVNPTTMTNTLTIPVQVVPASGTGATIGALPILGTGTVS